MCVHEADGGGGRNWKKKRRDKDEISKAIY